MMEGVRRGGDRQVLHERVRIHSHSVASGDELLKRIASDPLFGIDRKTMDAMANPNNYIGLSRQQTERFLIEEIDPILSANVVTRGTAEVRV
jgi:adenylosuccinate lyase